MRLELTVKNTSLNDHRIDLKVVNGLCELSCFDLLDLDKVEDLERQLTEMVSLLYKHRKAQKDAL